MGASRRDRPADRRRDRSDARTVPPERSVSPARAVFLPRGLAAEPSHSRSRGTAHGWRFPPSLALVRRPPRHRASPQVWPVLGTADAPDWTASAATARDRLFDVEADPTESLDLVASRPDAYAALRARFDALAADAAASVYCGADDAAAAVAAFAATGFLGPWTHDADPSCPD